MLPIAAVRGPRGPVPRCSRGFRAFFSRGGLGAGGWTANLPQSAAHRRRARAGSARGSAATPPRPPPSRSNRSSRVIAPVSTFCSKAYSLSRLLRSPANRLKSACVSSAGRSRAERRRLRRRAREIRSPPRWPIPRRPRPSSGSARMASHRPHPCRSVPTSRPRSSRGDHQGAGLSQCSSRFFTSGRSESHSAASSAARGPPRSSRR